MAIAGVDVNRIRGHGVCFCNHFVNVAVGKELLIGIFRQCIALVILGKFHTDDWVSLIVSLGDQAGSAALNES